MIDVLTNRYNAARTGANFSEDVLNQTNVNVNDFGKVFSRGVDGQIYAQPLIVSNLDIPQLGSRSVVFVATTRNMLYAFDAERPAAAHPIWRVNLDGPYSTPVPRSDYGAGYTDFTAEIGITSTPAIDLASRTIYLTSKTREYKRGRPHFLYKLHALDIRSGATRRGSAALIAETRVRDPENNYNAGEFTFVSGPRVKGTGTANINGVIHLNAFIQLQRTGLLLHDGVIYMGFGSHGDYNDYHGWILAYDAKTLKCLAAYCTTPDWGEGGVWQSGCGLAADDEGFVYAVCGNGVDNYRGITDPGTKRLSSGPFYGQCVLKLKLDRRAGKFLLKDWFTTADVVKNNQNDDDLCAGPVLLPWGNLLGAWGKDKAYYVLDGNKMGGFTPGRNAIVQHARRMTRAENRGKAGGGTGHIHCAPVMFSDPVLGPMSYVWGENDHLRGYPFDVVRRKFGTKPPENLISRHVLRPGMPGGMLTVSCNGTDARKAKGTAVVWALHPTSGDANHGTVAGVLEAFRADDLREPIFSSNHDPLGTDDLGDFAKFCPPVVANGKVYVATFSQQLAVYGLLPRSKPRQRSRLGKWRQADIPRQPGADTAFRVEGTASLSCHRFTILGGGADIGNEADAFHYVYKRIHDGSLSIVARVLRVANTSDGAKAGVMFRATMNADSAHAMMALTPAQGAVFLYRKVRRGKTYGTTFGHVGRAPYWVRLDRVPRGKDAFKFTGFISRDGVAWDQVSTPVVFRRWTKGFAGMAVTAQVDPDPNNRLQDLCAAVFDKVTILSPHGADGRSPAKLRA